MKFFTAISEQFIGLRKSIIDYAYLQSYSVSGIYTGSFSIVFVKKKNMPY